MSAPLAIAALYGCGAVGTAVYNLHSIVFITRPGAILRNTVFWPVFLPLLIVTRDEP